MSTAREGGKGEGELIGIFFADLERRLVPLTLPIIYCLVFVVRPWLIEINSSPCMAPTTSVTRRMCAQCLHDVIKGVYSKTFSLSLSLK